MPFKITYKLNDSWYLADEKKEWGNALEETLHHVQRAMNQGVDMELEIEQGRTHIFTILVNTKPKRR
jgi:hypothetical protein